MPRLPWVRPSCSSHAGVGDGRDLQMSLPVLVDHIQAPEREKDGHVNAMPSAAQPITSADRPCPDYFGTDECNVAILFSAISVLVSFFSRRNFWLAQPEILETFFAGLGNSANISLVEMPALAVIRRKVALCRSLQRPGGRIRSLPVSRCQFGNTFFLGESTAISLVHSLGTVKKPSS